MWGSNMNILSRTIKYITRKKSKSVLLLLVFLVVNVMLLSTNAMIHSLENTKDKIKQNTKSKLIVNIFDDNNPIKNTVIQELEELNNISFINKRSSVIMPLGTLKAVDDTSDKNLLNIIANDDLRKENINYQRVKYKIYMKMKLLLIILLLRLMT